MTNAEELIGLSRQTRVALTGERDSNNIITAGARQSMAFLARVEMELARIVTLEQERDELRAIVEGRKVAPTLAEIAKHSGEWLCDGEAVSLYFSDDHDTKLRVRAASMTASIGDTAARVWLLMKNAEGARWIALDDGRPCAWPKVTP